jgi:hypothetical protein
MFASFLIVGWVAKPKRDGQILHSNRIIYQPITILFLGVLFQARGFLRVGKET